jgi:hypothetical protein
MASHLSAATRAKLDVFLGSLPGSAAVKLADAIERDRLLGGDFPHDEILSALRPALRLARATRRFPTPQRIFFQSFAGMLIDDTESREEREIARASLEPVWSWLSRRMGETFDARIAEIAAGVAAERPVDCAPALLALRLEAAEALHAALATAGGRDEMVKQLGSHRAVQDALTLARISRLRLLESHLSVIRSASAGLFTAGELLNALEVANHLAGDFVTAQGNEETRRRAREARDTVKAALAKILEAAPEEIRRALPFAKMGGFGRESAPLDLRWPPDLVKFDRARDYAEILAGLDRIAGDTGLVPQLELARSGAVATARAFAQALTREIRVARPGSQAGAFHAPALALLTVLLPPEDTDPLAAMRPTEGSTAASLYAT